MTEQGKRFVGSFVQPPRQHLSSNRAIAGAKRCAATPIALAALLLGLSGAACAMEVQVTFTGTVSNSHLAGVAMGDTVSGAFFIDTDKAPAPFDTANRSDYGGPSAGWLDYTIAFNGQTFFDTRTPGVLPDNGPLITRIDDAPANATQVRDLFLLNTHNSLTTNGRAFLTLDVAQVVTGDVSPLMNSTALVAPVFFDRATASGTISAGGELAYSPNSILAPAAGFVLDTLQISQVSAVPEPSVAFLLLPGLGFGLAWLRRGQTPLGGTDLRSS